MQALQNALQQDLQMNDARRQRMLDRGEYWGDGTFWDGWVPIFSSSALLWGGISLLAIGAFRRRRARDRERLARWGEEERAAEALVPRWADERGDGHVN